MENTGYLKQKKQKQKRRRVCGLLFILLTVLALGGLLFYRKQALETEQQNPHARDRVVLEENQSWLELEIEGIVGNEIQAAGETYLIPVGTDVVTKLESVTTFSRLATGDKICCLTEKNGNETVILKIWIEE